MAERINMADASSVETGLPPTKDLPSRIFGEGEQPKPVVSSGEYQLPRASQQPPAEDSPPPDQPGTLSQEDIERAMAIAQGGDTNLPPSGISGDGGRGGEGSGGSEGPPQPPDRNSLEYESSPERGRDIAEEIIHWEAMRVAGRYNEVNWPRLDELYIQQEVHVEALRLVSLRVTPFEPEQQAGQVTPDILSVNPDVFVGFTHTLGEWIAVYEAGAITVTDRDAFIREVNVYFAEAKRVGLLKDLDAVLSAAYEREIIAGIRRGLTTVDIMSGPPGLPGVDDKIRLALGYLVNSFRDRLFTDPEIARLARVGELYARFAIDRFTTAINNRDIEGLTQRPYLIDNEFRLGEEGGEDVPKENFWHLEHGIYIYVDAQTKEEYQIAAESYLARLESITTSANELLQEARYFVQAIEKSKGFDKVNAESPGFITELVYQIEGRIGVFGADHSNELYKPEEYKQYMDYINKDGNGPDRWLQLARLLDGQVAATLFELDKDPRWEILFSLFGSRGQLAKASEVQRNGVGDQGLFAQVRDILIEEMMGVTIKDKRNVPNLTRWMPDRQFTSLFEGLFRHGKVPSGRSHGDTNIRAYEQFKDIPDRQLTPDQRRAKRLGRIQLELRGGKKVEELNPTDQKFYKDAWDTAKKAFDIAFQIYGALGEKSKRAGGVFKTDEKVDAAGRKFQYFVPVHYAEKFIQCAETLTKMKYANRSAKDRTAAVTKVRARNIAELKKNGFEAKLYDEDGNPMLLKRPKEDSNASDELARDTSGNVIVEEVHVDFYTATHHPYGDWTGHTYWSYQEEDRHLILSPVTFAQARKLRDGQLRPEDADPWAIQLLILDPTLRRVRRFDEKNFEERERKLTMAAVEDSYQSHWRIGRELYRAFFPKYGTPTKDIGIYYGLQDYGGFRKMIEHVRARAAEDPERFTRRGRRLIPDLHLPAVALSEYLGQGSIGALGVMRMFGAPIYRMCGTLALDKFSTQAEVGYKLYGALFNTEDQEKMIKEGLMLKLTNESDTTLQPFFGKLPQPRQTWADPGAQQEFCAAVRKSFNRLEIYEKLLTTMESTIRNATGAADLREVDVLTDDGQLNAEVERRFAALPDITDKELTRDELTRFIAEAEAIGEKNEEDFNSAFNEAQIDEGPVSFNTGSGRHNAQTFHYAFFAVMLDHLTRGGAELYRGERYIYEHLKDKIVSYDPNQQRALLVGDETIIDWLFVKFVPT